MSIEYDNDPGRIPVVDDVEDKLKEFQTQLKKRQKDKNKNKKQQNSKNEEDKDTENPPQDKIESYEDAAGRIIEGL